MTSWRLYIGSSMVRLVGSAGKLKRNKYLIRLTKDLLSCTSSIVLKYKVDLNDKLYKNACYIVACSVHLYHMYVSLCLSWPMIGKYLESCKQATF